MTVNVKAIEPIAIHQKVNTFLAESIAFDWIAKTFIIRYHSIQVDRIEDEENRVKKEIENLGRKLDTLGKHKEGYQDK